MLVARKALKRMYALLHVAPGERAQKILFDEEPPADSRLFALKELARAESPADQARAIVEHAIPYRVAATVVKQMTPTVLLALIERMSPQELINNLGALRRRGAFDNPDLKALIEAKLQEAKTAERVSAFKAEEAMKAADLSDDVRRTLEEVADAQVKAKGRIDRPTALLIDKSGSMSVAIELGKRIGALVSSVSAQALYVYAFDTSPTRSRRPAPTWPRWEKALKGITAGGGTSCGVALEMHAAQERSTSSRSSWSPTRARTPPPLFVETLKKYREEVKADPNVCFVRTPGGADAAGRPVPEGRDHGRCVPVHGRLLRPAEPGAAAVPAVEDGPADGNPGVPAAGPQAGLSGVSRRIDHVDRSVTNRPAWSWSETAPDLTKTGS